MQDKTIREQPDAVRLQVFLAHAGVASRRASEAIIKDGRVTVNGTVVAEPSFKVLPSDTVLLDGAPLGGEEKKRYVLLNKPEGVVCSLSDEKGRATAADILRSVYTERLYNVGRLDMFSRGLIIFTNDGDFAAKISHPSFELEKEYEIETVCTIPDTVPKRFEQGVRIDNVFYRAKCAEKIGARRMRVILIEGKNREIRNVMDSFSIGIKHLTRIRIGNLGMDYYDGSGKKVLAPGEFRNLTDDEVKMLKTPVKKMFPLKSNAKFAEK